MMHEELAEIPGDSEGYELVQVRRDEAAAPPRLMVELAPVADHAKGCSRCGEVVWEIHGIVTRGVRDLPIEKWET